MLTALFLILSVAQAPDGWRVLDTAEEPGMTAAWRLAADDAGGGEARRAVMRLTAPDREWAAAEMDLEYACAGQTSTILGVRAFDAAGAVTRSVRAMPEQLRPEPIYADDVLNATIHAELCPGAAPLAARPDHPPPIPVPPAPRGE